MRIGSALAKQLQVDNYGELMDSAGLCDDWYGPISIAQWDAITAWTERVCNHWDQPHEGVRESGTGPETLCPDY